MSLFNIGPDGLILVEALIVSVVVAVLAWQRAGLSATAILTVIVAIALLAWQHSVLPSGPGHPLIVASFIAVPTALLLGASRLRWIARHAWLLILAGPIIFVACYVGICELCVKAGLLS